jgi:hypothetical protein
MVAKLLLAIQEAIWTDHDNGGAHLQELLQIYREVREGLGYNKSPDVYGAFPFDPYSHTPGDGGAQQPGMTGQVKEEVLTRWGELGLRWRNGRLQINPVLLDREEIPDTDALKVSYCGMPISYRRAQSNALRVRTEAGWQTCPDAFVPLQLCFEIEVDVA